ncbi:MAG: cation transporter [Marinilabiliales bacterium]|nr:MAG: cation transporter [Marinilabiliales bacterium]
MIFVKSKGRNISGKFAGFFSIAGNTVLFAFKLWAGLVTGSVALIADAWHTLSDSVSSVILLIGIYVSSKPADNEHPYGHGRAEVIASLFIGLILVLIAINFLYESVNRIITGETVIFGYLAITVTAISLVVKEIMAQISFYASRNEGSKALFADGWHHRSDAFTSLIILVGILLGRYIWWIDGALGAFVSVMILILAFRIVKDSIDPLLGEKPDKELIDKINNIGNEIYSGELYSHHFNIHKYGNHTELTFHIKLPGNYKLDNANRITALFIKRIRSELDIVATIYIDAYKEELKQ